MLCLIFALPAVAATIGFDDIDASLGDVILGSYQGFTFQNFSAYTTVPGFPGFNNGIVSPNNAAYSGGEFLGAPVLGRITAPTLFDFTGASIGSGYYNNLAVTLQGLLSGTPVFTQTVTVGTQGAQAFTFAFTGISELVISGTATASSTDPYTCGPVNCNLFTIDDANLTLLPTPPPPAGMPEPSTLALLAFGIFALFPLRRLRRSQQ